MGFCHFRKKKMFVCLYLLVIDSQNWSVNMSKELFMKTCSIKSSFSVRRYFLQKSRVLKVLRLWDNSEEIWQISVLCLVRFVQFHPTALADEGLPIKPQTARENAYFVTNAFLVTEAVRGDGGILYNLGMERFMPAYDERAELAPRDVVARSIDDQLKKGNEKYVLLDMSHKPREKILAHFPNIASECLKHGLDITCQPIPVVPAAHYMCGGVRAGLQGETNVLGLFVAGEVACTGLHGANRLASNSLLEALVFARRAVQPSTDLMKHTILDLSASEKWTRPVVATARSLGDEVISKIISLTKEVRRELQEVMWKYVGIVRSTIRLNTADFDLKFCF